MLKRYGVEIRTGHKVIEITSSGVKAVTKKEKNNSLGRYHSCSFGMKPNKVLAEKLASKYYTNSCIIGDCQQSLRLVMLFEGFHRPYIETKVISLTGNLAN